MVCVITTKILLFSLCLSAETNAPSTSEKTPPGSPDPLGEATILYREGHPDEAAQRYQQLLQVQPKSDEDYAGLARVYLKQQRVQPAHEAISKGLALAESPTIRVAQGELLFREGKLPEAESEWLAVINSGHALARAHLGLARISAAPHSTNRQKRKSMKSTHLILAIQTFSSTGFVRWNPRNK
jgi:predicted Zn-dependent protease